MVAVSAILVAVLGAVFWRPLALGIPPSGVIACAAFVVGHVFVPGWFAWRALRRRSSDALVDVGMALSLGGALQMLAVAAAASSGWIEHLGWYPAVALPLALVAGRARNDDFADEHEPARLRTGHWLALAALSIIAGARTETYALALAPGSATKDLLFHAGNAAEYRHHWPLTDPRIALEPLVYHFFAYGMPVGASVVTGIPTDELVLSYLGCVAPVLLGLQLFNVARMLGASAGAGLVAAAVALLHVDLGTVLARGFGADGLGRLFLSHLDSGVYHSPTTAPSLVLTITLLPFVAQCLAAERGFDARPWCACALLAATLSGVKGSVIPVAAAALGLVVVWRVVRERTFDRRAATLGATLALAALPMTLYLVADEGGYARSMFAWDPLNLVRASPFAALVADGAGTSLGVLALLLPLWLVGHLGIASLGLFARLRARESWTASERWSLCFVLVGLVPALLLGAAGLSQLFFVYPAQVVLAWLVAPTLTRRFTARSPMTWIFALWIAASLWAIAIGLPEQWRQERDGNQAAPGAGAECHAVTAWLREHTPNDAVLIVRSGPIVLSVSSERRVFLETSIYSPGRHATRSRHFEPGHAGGEESEVWADRRELEAAALSRPTPAVFASIRERTPGAGPFYVFQSRGADGRNLASAASGLELVHETDSTRIYRVIEH
ncbi:MAG: hypothetical protein K8S98_15680 [Planctomycetes bacterium]|nr:hypothetical protein [Planctomycetota bacterium]